MHVRAAHQKGVPASRPTLRCGSPRRSARPAQLWHNLQADYDVQLAQRDLGKILDRIETVNKPKAA